MRGLVVELTSTATGSLTPGVAILAVLLLVTVLVRWARHGKGRVRLRVLGVLFVEADFREGNQVRTDDQSGSQPE
jgi:hypothetical protein